MTYLVTGAAGFIGSHVVAHLLDGGHDVHGIDNLNEAYDPRLKEWRLDQLESREAFRFDRVDVRDRDAVGQVLAETDVDAVLNLAARAGVRQSMEDPWLYHETNGGGTLTLLEAARKHGVDTCLLASTSSIYGRHNDVPFSEDARTDRPPSPYAASKKAAEAYAATYADLYGIDTPVTRFFTVYGPAGRPKMSVFRFIRWVMDGQLITVYGDGTQRRDFTFVEDVARGAVRATDAIDGFEVVNLGNDDPIQLLDMIETIEDAVGREAEIRYQEGHPADLDATWADIGKAKRLLDWKPRVGFEEGIRRTVEWFEQEYEWARDIDLGEV